MGSFTEGVEHWIDNRSKENTIIVFQETKYIHLLQLPQDSTEVGILITSVIKFMSPKAAMFSLH